MHNSTEFDYPSEFEDVAPRDAVTCRDAAIVVLARGYAANDATRDDTATTRDEIEAWAQHARAANGLGDLEPVAEEAPMPPTSDWVHPAGRIHHALSGGAVITATVRAVVALARRMYARHLQRRQARTIYDTLRQLDNRTLHDLGFDRSEIRSVAAELTGEAQYTRVRTLQTAYGLPR